MQEGSALCLKLKMFRRVLSRPDKEKKNSKEELSALYEQQLYFFCVQYKIISLLCERLSNIYNIHFEAAEFIKEAASTIDQDWDKIRKQIKNEINAKKLIDSVFNNKIGESSDGNP
ncbi:MAG: hypothetical protein WDL87_01975 [Candidatus Omnitrophota bacterium]|jgi:hypothetical protein